MVIVTFVWQTSMDAKACSKCRELHGYSWSFVDELPPVLEHPGHGVVYDIDIDQTRTHGMAVHNCRCGLTIDIDDADLLQYLDELENETAQLISGLDSAYDYVNLFARLVEGILYE